MKLTFRDLKKIIGEAVKDVRKEFDKDMSWASAKNPDKTSMRGRDGYVEVDEDDQCQPHGFSKSVPGDFSERLSDTTEDGSLYKKQGQSNMGPYTNEQAVRDFIRKSIVNEIAKKKGIREEKKIHISEGNIWNSLGEFIKTK